MPLYVRLVALPFFLLILPIYSFAQTTPNFPTQAEPPVSITVEFFAPGVSTVTGTPIQPGTTYPWSAVACNKVPQAVVSPVVNPSKILLPDPDPTHKGMDCELPASIVVPLVIKLPVGVGYVVVVRVNGTVFPTGDRSAASNPFSRQIVWTPPPVLSGVKVLP